MKQFPQLFKQLPTLTAIAALLFLTACARTQISSERSTSSKIPKPGVIVVHDFSVSPDQVALDHTIGLRLQELVGTQTDSVERLKLAQKIASLVATNVVTDLKKLGYESVVASPDYRPPTGSLTVEGQFFSIDQGNQRRRMIIGFGAGASEVRVLVQAFENSPTGPQLVEDFYATVQSSRRPGLGPMGGAGATAVSKATSGTLSLLGGGNAQSVEADARHLADSITQELKGFFSKQGW
jgi:hypothetical protein